MLLLGMDVWRENLQNFGQLLLLLAAALTLWSMVLYMRAAMPVFSQDIKSNLVDKAKSPP
jgi:CDP-diacylglycerol--glycerol-3-phosphate 3-phosphatidyltransferase